VDGDLSEAVRRGLAYALDGRLAPHYERHLVHDCRYSTPQVLADALAGLAPPGGRFLDLGAGSGLVGEAAVDRGLALQFVAIDLSEAMLTLIDCTAYIDRRQADCTLALPYPDAWFDGAVAAGLLEHVPDPARVFASVARAIRPGAPFLFTYPPNRFGRTELIDTEQGLLSHDVDATSESLETCGLCIAGEREYPAYLNGAKGWLTHRLVVCHRSAASDAK